MDTEFNNNIEEANSLTQTYNTLEQQEEYLHDLKNKYIKENYELTMKMNYIFNDIVTNDRKTYYQNQNMTNINGWYSLYKVVYIILLVYARNVLKIKDATSSEFSKKGSFLIGTMHEWQDETGKKTKKAGSDMGGTMRLGAYPCQISKGTLAEKIYGKTAISERHRHRYEVNINYKDQLEKAGLKFSGMSPDGKLPEIVEIKDHPFFIGVQFHPELKSKPFAAHPLFVSFIASAIKHQNA
jgi:hypothetical protein